MDLTYWLGQRHHGMVEGVAPTLKKFELSTSIIGDANHLSWALDTDNTQDL